MYLTTTNKLIIILAIVVLVMALTFGNRAQNCSTYSCFQQKLTQCKTVKYISEEENAAYLYFVKGKTQGQCEVEVLLLEAKGGPLRLDELEGLKMTCIYPLGFNGLPGKELSSCSGPLKEGFQTKIITGLQEYIVGNVPDILG